MGRQRGGGLRQRRLEPRKSQKHMTFYVNISFYVITSL